MAHCRPILYVNIILQSFYPCRYYANKGSKSMLNSKLFDSLVCKPKSRWLSTLRMSLLLPSLLIGTIDTASADGHSQLPNIPCHVRLVFGTDDKGMPSISYKLELQIKNRTAGIIKGVSVYWLDSQSKIIGNSGSICGINNEGVNPSEAGHCEAIVQEVGGSLLMKLGQKTWTEIVNYELNTFKNVKKCAVVGYDFYNQKHKND